MTSIKATEAIVIDLLKKVKYPGYSRDIISFGMLKEVSEDNGTLTVKLAMNGVEESIARQIQEESRNVLKSESDFKSVLVDMDNTPTNSHSEQDEPVSHDKLFDPQPLQGIKKIIAVSSGKGGVGKSTVAVNLACIAAKQGLKVGIFDADIHGPSLPTLLAIDAQPEASDDAIRPFEKYGIKAMSIGFLIDSGQPLIWRGPMLNKALEQICEGTAWGDLDVLFIDLPPGTGDVQISLTQKYRIDGALVVTTPQDLALEDVRRGAIMFQHTNIPILGIVENMSYFRCSHCGDLSHPFGEGGGSKEAQGLGLPLLGSIPLDAKARELSDRGIPIVVEESDSETVKAYLDIWENAEKRLEEMLVS
jgi:ATP-binding protein involved in chromosome partitioning